MLRATRRPIAIALSSFLLIGCSTALGGHSLGHYPSYYPDEIRIDTIDPAAAARALGEGKLQAYVGAPPAFAGRVPDHVKPVESLGSFLVLVFNGAAGAPAGVDSRCAVARRVLAKLRGTRVPGFVFHPYPVTPFHADYLHHLDRVERAKSAVRKDDGTAPPPKVRAEGRLAKHLVRAHWPAAGDDAEAVLKEVSAADLIVGAGMQLDGRAAVPWAKEGWFQAYRLLRPSLGAGLGQARNPVEEVYDRLIGGEYRSFKDEVNLQRRLVAGLTRACDHVVAGFTVRLEYANDTFSSGVENLAWDSHFGLAAPLFLRTVKLKEYPWNGTLRLGVRGRAEVAWNPVAGFTDPAGRLIWAALGDPALISFPDNASWIPNRVHVTVSAARGRSGGLKVPADALLPEPGSGRLKPVGAHAFSTAKIHYEVLASPFLDGSETTVADLLYPFVFAFRWGHPEGPGGTAYEPRVEAASGLMRDLLVGVRAVRVERTVKAIAPGFDIVQTTPVLEVYLRAALGDDHQLAALAPPWSTVPWHVLALMEEAVLKGYAAFSKEEAERRRTRWLDLARDEALRAQLLGLVTEFEQRGYRPEPLKDLVTAEEARRRWRALKTFAEKNGHFLITNGPYRLEKWTADSVVLKAVREATYPLGFGSFDRYVHPPRAVVSDVTRTPRGVRVRADADITWKVERHYEVRREPLTRKTSHGLFGLLVISRYLLIAPDGTVVDVDKMEWRDDGRFAIDLPKGIPPGEYTLVLAVFLDGNTLHPSARMLRVRIGDGRVPPG